MSFSQTTRSISSSVQRSLIQVSPILWESRSKTTLIDFATGYEKEPIESIVDFRWFENLEAVILPASIKKVGRNAFDSCTKLTTVYYYGTPAEWENVELVGTEIKYIGEEDVKFFPNKIADCTVYFYSEQEPTQAGNYWHLVDGKPTKW